MSKLIALTFTFALAATLGGCSSPEVDGTVGEQSIIIRRVPPKPPLVAWQFRDCLTPNQRAGLPQALLQMYSEEARELGALAGTVADSQCIGGHEAGGLFWPSVSAAERLRSLQYMDFRGPARLHAFQISHEAIAAVAAPHWAASPVAKRFDDQGRATPDGRYEITGYSYTLPPLDGVTDHGLFDLHVVDHQTQATANLEERTFLFVDQGLLHSGTSVLEAAPASSPDPFVQTIINAATPFAADYNQHVADHFELAWPDQWAFNALYFPRCPSLKGWDLSFDTLAIDALGNVAVQGGDLIL